MLLLLYFVLLVIVFYKSKSVALLLTVIQVISLTAMLFINLDYEINTLSKIFNLLFTALILTLVISPWSKMKNIKAVTIRNEDKIKKLTRFLLIISILPFIVYSIVSVIVISQITDINEFKYGEGVANDFYYNVLPFNIKFFILANYTFYFSFFLIPLHFYYLHKKKYALAFVCFLFSLNLILNGLTYFSRSAFVHYGLLYLAFLTIFYGTLSAKTKSIIKKVIVIAGVLMGLYFISITTNRFDNDSVYEENIPLDSPIQDPALYSYLDYLSQSHFNGMYVLDSYDFNTFKGQTALQPVLALLGQYGLINYHSADYKELRKKLWPEHHYTFNGLVSYSVFDFGYIITLILALIYYYYISKMKPKNSTIYLEDLFSVVLVIQIPLLAIFYSTISVIIIPLLFFIGIHYYLKTAIE